MPLQPDICYVRFLNAIPEVFHVDIYVNGQKMDSKLAYAGFTKYFPALEGIYHISITPAGEATEILNQYVEFQKKMIYTVIFTGINGIFDIEVVPDKKEPKEKDAFMRFINVSPYDTSYRIEANGETLVEGLEFQEDSDYYALIPGKNILHIYNEDSERIVITHPNLELYPDHVYGGYIVGVEGEGEGVEILVSLEGATYLDF